MDRLPPLEYSPRRLRPRRPPPGFYAPSAQAPPVTSKKRPPPNRSAMSVDSPIRPQHQPISSDFPALARIVKSDFCENLSAVASMPPGAGNWSPLFERGRFYELYSARRNERLKRKAGDVAEEAVAQDPSVGVELAKRKVSKKAESVRKSVPADFSASRASSFRSSLRNSREMKKRYCPVAGPECSAAAGRRISTRSVRKL